MNPYLTRSSSERTSVFDDLVTGVGIDLKEAWLCLKHPHQRISQLRIPIAEEAMRHAVDLIRFLPEDSDTRGELQQRLEHAFECFYVKNPLNDKSESQGSGDGVSIEIDSSYRSPSDNFKQSRALAALQKAVAEGEKEKRLLLSHMKEVLRQEDCLYDNAELWTQLRATSVPEIPDTVIQEAYETGGRVSLRCSSISEKADALTEANHAVVFRGDAMQSDYQESVSEPEWIVVPSHIDRSMLGRPRHRVVTSEMPAPTPEDWFSVLAYARLDGGRQPQGCKPQGCEELYAFTTEFGMVVGLDLVGDLDFIVVYRCNSPLIIHETLPIGAARFGPPRN
jgi:hypothetical protein